VKGEFVKVEGEGVADAAGCAAWWDLTKGKRSEDNWRL